MNKEISPHRGKGPLLALEKQGTQMSRAITVKHIHLHLFSVVLHCIFIQINRKLDRAKACEAHLPARHINFTAGWVG